MVPQYCIVSKNMVLNQAHNMFCIFPHIGLPQWISTFAVCINQLHATVLLLMKLTTS